MSLGAPIPVTVCVPQWVLWGTGKDIIIQRVAAILYKEWRKMSNHPVVMSNFLIFWHTKLYKMDDNYSSKIARGSIFGLYCSLLKGLKSVHNFMFEKLKKHLQKSVLN